MRELRVLGAVVLASGGWWTLVLIGQWFEPGESFLVAWFPFVPLGACAVRGNRDSAAVPRDGDEGACHGGRHYPAPADYLVGES